MQVQISSKNVFVLILMIQFMVPIVTFVKEQKVHQTNIVNMFCNMHFYRTCLHFHQFSWNLINWYSVKTVKTKKVKKKNSVLRFASVFKYWISSFLSEQRYFFMTLDLNRSISSKNVFVLILISLMVPIVTFYQRK